MSKTSFLTFGSGNRRGMGTERKFRLEIFYMQLERLKGVKGNVRRPKAFQY